MMERQLGISVCQFFSSLIFAILLPAIVLAKADGAVPVTHPGLSEHRDQDRAGQTQVRLVRGELLQIEGGKWVIRDTEGHELDVYVDHDTRKEGSRPGIGALVEIEVAPSGHADAIRSLSEAGSARGRR